eukprot:6070224-Pyramimonas_sp.AAC.1
MREIRTLAWRIRTLAWRIYTLAWTTDGGGNAARAQVRMLCHRGPVKSMVVDREGYYMATAGLDCQVRPLPSP